MKKRIKVEDCENIMHCDCEHWTFLLVRFKGQLGLMCTACSKIMWRIKEDN